MTASTARTRKDSQSTSLEKQEASKGYRLGTAEENDRAKILEAAHALEQVKVPVMGAGRRDFEISSSSRSGDFGTEQRVEGPRERIIPIRLEGQEDEEEEEEEANLKRALQLSLRELEDTSNCSAPTRSTNQQRNSRPDRDSVVMQESDDDEDMKKALQLSLECVTTPATPETDEDLRKALQLSLECVTAPATRDPDDLRRRRLAYLENLFGTTTNESSAKLNT